MAEPTHLQESDPVHGEEGDPHTRDPRKAGIDREVLYRRIMGVAAGSVALLAISACVCALLYSRLERGLIAEDPAPSPLHEAKEPVLPPPPRLQRDPRADMDAFRAEENAILQSYGWVDEEGAVARIPIDRAIELKAKHGARAALVGPGGPAAGAPETGGGP